MVAEVNKPSLIDVANGLESMVVDIEYSLNKILRPLYEELYSASENKEEKVAQHIKRASKALFKAAALLESYKNLKSCTLPLIKIENLRHSQQNPEK